MKKKFGKIKIKKIKPGLDDIPEDCGYEKKFRFNIDMNSNGIMGECIEWCQVHCEGKWGWWFQNANRIDNPSTHWEDQDSYMSFQYKRDATKFWLAIGVNSMGERNR